ncbi:MAG: DUF1499 domain-containing protein [Oceanococcaceae bacterium]
MDVLSPRGVVVGGLLVLLALSGCASLSAHPTGLTESGQLQPCPSAPRCVSSVETDPRHSVTPLYLRAADDGLWTELLDVLSQQPRTTLVEIRADYVRAEILSPWGLYIDDLELHRRVDSPVIQMRSSGRIGYYDFQVNRERVEALRAAAAAAGLLREPADG